MYNFDPYSVLLAIATDVAVLLVTASVLRGHIWYVYIVCSGSLMLMLLLLRGHRWYVYIVCSGSLMLMLLLMFSLRSAVSCWPVSCSTPPARTTSGCCVRASICTRSSSWPCSWESSSWAGITSSAGVCALRLYWPSHDLTLRNDSFTQNAFFQLLKTTAAVLDSCLSIYLCSTFFISLYFLLWCVLCITSIYLRGLGGWFFSSQAVIVNKTFKLNLLEPNKQKHCFTKTQLQ